MLFNSYIFIFAFLPIVLLAYFGFNHFQKYTWANLALIGGSLFFYGYLNPVYVLLILGSVFFNFGLYTVLGKHPKKSVLVAGITANLLVLGYFKYFDFFLSNINFFFGTSLGLLKIALPLGISFFTFQQISFLVDTYKGEKMDYSLVEYMLFVSFFPQLIAGPIVTHEEMITQFRQEEKRRFSYDSFAKGIGFFVIGLSKKILIADSLGRAVDFVYRNEAVLSLDSVNTLLVSLCYTFQLFLDFSGYCDMAKGVGYFFGIEIPDNFDTPFQAVGIRNFWKKWHITLGRFFTRYVYIPLGGSRRGKAITCRNAAIVFALSGLWHGAEWTFVIWGLLHGIGYIYDYLLQDKLKAVPRLIRRLATFLYVNFAFIAFRCENLEQMLRMYKNLFTGGIGAPLREISGFFLNDFMTEKLMNWNYYNTWLVHIPFAGLMLLVGGWLLFGKSTRQLVEGFKYKWSGCILLAVLFLACVMKLSEVSVFLYFNF